jgi:arylformamidase
MLISSLTKIAVATLLFGAATSSFAGPMQGFFRHRGGRQQLGNRNFDRSAEQSGPVTLPAGARLVQNVAYGADSAQRFDVYIPPNARNAPVIFMVHGGGWSRGDKAASNVVQNKINHFLPMGYIFISTNYRMVPQVGVMTEAEDVARALAYVQQHAAEWGGDSSRLVVMGHSAGAHLVALMTSAPSIWQGAGARPWLGTVALDSAAYNVVTIMESQHYPFYDRVFGDDQQLWQAVSPTLQLRSAPPPMLLVCSSLRSNSCDQASAFADKAQSLGGHVKVVPVELKHSEVNMDVGSSAPITSEIDAFLHSLGLN